MTNIQDVLADMYLSNIDENHPLTLGRLHMMQPGIFAVGQTQIPTLSIVEDICWAAVRGGIHDWAIYGVLASRFISYDEIARSGDKIHDSETIRHLVTCTDDAFEMYRH